MHRGRGPGIASGANELDSSHEHHDEQGPGKNALDHRWRPPMKPSAKQTHPPIAMSRTETSAVMTPPLVSQPRAKPATHNRSRSHANGPNMNDDQEHRHLLNSHNQPHRSTQPISQPRANPATHRPSRSHTNGLNNTDDQKRYHLLNSHHRTPCRRSNHSRPRSQAS